MRTGIADLPLHYGKAPSWLFSRMKNLSGKIAESIILDFSEKEFLKRLSDPYFFQAFACVLGYDWHSSGTTTVTCAALKESLNSLNLGIKVAGGKGKSSRNVFKEIENSEFNFSERKINNLKKASKLSAKVDNNCIQDNYFLYHHNLIFTEKGNWAVIQQGMSPENKFARRYHWLSWNVKNFVQEPQNAVCCNKKEKRVLDLTSKKSKETRKISLDIVKENPDHLRRYFSPRGQKNLFNFCQREIYLKMPFHHEILDSDLNDKVLKNLKAAYEIQPKNYEELVSLKGIGSKSLRALALISQLIYGSEVSWEDPVKYSFAHGGKDGIPFPVNKKVYDSSIRTLKEALESAEIGKKEKLNALKKLSKFEI